jgi:two-component system LytT family response regulator
MKILIIEDEIPAANKLVKLLAAIDESIKTDTCRTVEESVLWLKNNPAPYLILMDIELADGKSFEIFEQVKITSPTVFITAYDEYAIKALKLHALDYLLKPVTKTMLEETLEAAKQNIANPGETVKDFSELQKLITEMTNGKRPKKLAVNSREGTSFIPFDDIIRLEADSNYTHIILINSKKITIPKTLKDYEDILAGFGFLRIHNGHIINLQFVEKYVKGKSAYVTMKDGSSVEVSQSRTKELMTALGVE